SLSHTDPDWQWNEFFSTENDSVVWDSVIMSGASHGATTSARFALHQRVDRVVMFCGPRDQYESWQSLPSATPKERFIVLSHVLDTGWTGDNYCRSWEMLGLNKYGPLVDVDLVSPPFGNSRRLITDADVNHDEKRAHSCVTPGKAAVKDNQGRYVHAAVWRYLFDHPVDQVGQAVEPDTNCRKELR
ncbi:MAG: BPSS1187 family protein, partial [Pirellula sp.]